MRSAGSVAAQHGIDVTAVHPLRPLGDALDSPRRRERYPSRCMLICMHSTSVRIDSATHEDLKRLARELNTTVGNTVTLAVRALRQGRIGTELRAPLTADETAWL